MTFVVRMESEHVASLTATKELLIRIRDAFGCDCQELIDDVEEVLFRAELEHKLPYTAGELLQMARERGLMPDEAYELDDPKSNRYHSVHADLWDKREGK